MKSFFVNLLKASVVYFFFSEYNKMIQYLLLIIGEKD